jgi:beta-N-acetylhexosaminidase
MREIDELPPEALAGQLLVVGFDGVGLPDSTHRDLITGNVGGVILFRRNLPDLRTTWELCREIRDSCTPEFPPFIAIDQEGGRVARLRDGVIQLPPMRVLGAQDDLELSRALAGQQVRELLALGLNLNFSPVADVDSNPQNPVIGDRAFSADPTVVTRHCRVFIEEFQNAGVMACIKHFPGHGDTATDSHFDLPTVTRSTVQLRQVELYPFERLARTADSVMTAHVVFSAFDDQPATMSARLCSLLRKEFAFEGVLFSDDLEMGALSKHWPIEQSAVRAIEAGCDALLVCSDHEAQQRARAALATQIENDATFRARCREAAERGVTARRRRPPRPASSYEQVESVLTSSVGVQLRKRLVEL